MKRRGFQSSIFMSLTLGTLACTAGTATQPQAESPGSVEAGLDRINALRDSLAAEELLDQDASDELLKIVLNPGEQTLVRIAAVMLLCEKARQPSAEETVETMKAFAMSIRGAGSLSRQEANARHALICELIMRGATSVAPRIGDQTQLLDFFLDTLKHPVLMEYKYIRDTCYQRIADSPASLVVRQDYAARAIRVRPGDPPPIAFFTLLDDDLVNRLRPIIFEEPVSRRGYNMGAIGLLAEYGDQETGARFRAWALERGIDDVAINAVGGFVWTIDSQHRPEMLLDHLRSNEWINHQTRIWALNRAIRLGVDQSKIRAALLDHANSVGTDKRLLLLDVSNLKAIAAKKGILKPGDLPDVPDPRPANAGWMP